MSLPSDDDLSAAVQRELAAEAALRAAVRQSASIKSAAVHLLKLAEILIPASGIPFAGGAAAVARIALEEFDNVR